MLKELFKSHKKCSLSLYRKTKPVTVERNHLFIHWTSCSSCSLLKTSWHSWRTSIFSLSAINSRIFFATCEIFCIKQHYSNYLLLLSQLALKNSNSVYLFTWETLLYVPLTIWSIPAVPHQGKGEVRVSFYQEPQQPWMPCSISWTRPICVSLHSKGECPTPDHKQEPQAPSDKKKKLEKYPKYAIKISTCLRKMKST